MGQREPKNWTKYLYVAGIFPSFLIGSTYYLVHRQMSSAFCVFFYGWILSKYIGCSIYHNIEHKLANDMTAKGSALQISVSSAFLSSSMAVVFHIFDKLKVTKNLLIITGFGVTGGLLTYYANTFRIVLQKEWIKRNMAKKIAIKQEEYLILSASIGTLLGSIVCVKYY